MLSKKDLLLAQKTFDANRAKFETRNPGRAYTPAGTTRPRPGSVQASRIVRSVRRGEKLLGKTMSMSRLRELDMQELPDIEQDVNTRRPGTTMSMSPVKSASKKTKSAHELSGEELIEELGRRGMTSTVAMKKTVMGVAKDLKEKTGEVDYNDPEFLEATSKEDYYMPKVVITRPDGATLMDIYRSKQADTWSLILKAQLKEEEIQKKRDHKTKLQANEDYGVKLRADLNFNEARDASADGQDVYLAALTEETSRKHHEMMQKRKTDATDRQKQFIQHALIDIERKRVRKEKELNHELEAAMKTNDKGKALIAMDVRKKDEKKVVEGKRLASLWEENQAENQRKSDIKRLDGEENIRIFRIGEARAQAEEDKRSADLARKMKKAGDGPAHSVAAQVTTRFRAQQDSFYKMNEAKDNMLNRQLMASEGAAASKSKSQGANLTAEWDKLAAFKAKKDDEDWERLRKIQAYNLLQTKKHDVEDEEKRDKKRKNALRYQRELDAQLAISRQKSIDSLKKTMSDKERRFNSDLLMKTGLIRDPSEL